MKRAKPQLFDHAAALPEVADSIALWARTITPQAVVLDTETTGTGKQDEVIDLCIVRAGDGAILFDSLFRPTVPISSYSRAIHGLSWGDVANAPRFQDCWDEIKRITQDVYVLAWGVSFDRRMMGQMGGAVVDTWQWECLMRAYQKWRGLATPCKLGVACEALGVRTGVHRAKSDALAAARVLFKMAQSSTVEVTITRGASDADLDDPRADDALLMTAREYLLEKQWKELARVELNAGGENVTRSSFIHPASGRVFELASALDEARRP